VVINEDHPTLTADDIPVQDPTYISGTTLYIFNGWYTQRTDTSATYVKLDGDLANLDTDGDGLIELYAGWESMSSAKSFFSFDTNQASAYVTGSHSSSNNYRMYFVVPADGNYSVSVGNVASGTATNYQKDLRIYTYKHGTKSSEFVNSYTNAATSLTYVNYNASSYSGLQNLKAGDVIVVQLYYRSSSSTYNSTVYAKISGTPTTYEDALNYAESFDSEKTYISTNINQPYMLTLFYTEADPYAYIETRQVRNPGAAFEWIDSYDKYYFYLPNKISPSENAVYIVENENISHFDSSLFEIKQFYRYSVAVPLTMRNTAGSSFY
jgi:hypothetical protein